MAAAWDRLGDEPGVWYGRFEFFRLLGSGRSLDAAYRAWKEAQPPGTKGCRGARANRHWHTAARRWQWLARAEAWDAAERETLRAQEAARRFDARQRRLAIIDEQREAAVHALQVAGLAQLDPSKPEDVLLAIKLMPSVRVLLSEMMRAERLEYGEATEIVEENGPAVAEEVQRLLDMVYGDDDPANE